MPGECRGREPRETLQRRPMSSGEVTGRFVLLVVLAAAIIWFAGLGYRDLIEPDEGRYAEIPREMVASGDWITPRLNDYKYFYKPVLQYWATATAFTLFGESSTTARLWPALLGFLGALWGGFVAWRLYGATAGFYAGLITLSALLYVVDGHYLVLDMSLSVFLAVGLGCLLLAQQQRDDPVAVRNWMLTGWGALALATMTKGPIGAVLPAMTVVVYSLWTRDWQLWRHLHIVRGLLLFLLITAPWFIAVSLANPEFLEFFFIREHLERYTSTVHEREGGWWYFIPVFLLGIFPWIALALASLFRPGFPARSSVPQGFHAERFLWTFAVVVFVFFSLGQSKLPSYILPMIPAIAILAGQRLASRGYLRADAWLLTAMALGLFILALFITRFDSNSIPAALYVNYRPWVLAGASLFAVAAFIAVRYRPLRSGHIAVIGLLSLLAIQVVLSGFQALSPSRSSQAMAADIREAVPAGTEVFALATFPKSLPFYLQQTMTLVVVKDEIEISIMQEPGRWIGSLDEFRQRWQAADQAVAVFRTHDLDEFRSMLEPMQVIHRNPRRTAVIKR